MLRRPTLPSLSGRKIAPPPALQPPSPSSPQGGQFNDHHVSFTAPMSDSDGVSTVSTKGEVTNLGLPIGPAFRVPLCIISPWTRGHIVVSEFFDHTSVLKFIGAWAEVIAATVKSARLFGAPCPGAPPGRRTPSFRICPRHLCPRSHFRLLAAAPPVWSSLSLSLGATPWPAPAPNCLVFPGHPPSPPIVRAAL